VGAGLRHLFLIVASASWPASALLPSKRRNHPLHRRVVTSDVFGDNAATFIAHVVGEIARSVAEIEKTPSGQSLRLSRLRALFFGFEWAASVGAFREMLTALAQDYNVALTADVPKVSRVTGLGIVMLARESGRPILPSRRPPAGASSSTIGIAPYHGRAWPP
jgi:hypothetical protein